MSLPSNSSVSLVIAPTRVGEISTRLALIRHPGRRPTLAQPYMWRPHPCRAINRLRDSPLGRHSRDSPTRNRPSPGCADRSIPPPAAGVFYTIIGRIHPAASTGQDASCDRSRSAVVPRNKTGDLYRPRPQNTAPIRLSDRTRRLARGAMRNKRIRSPTLFKNVART